MAPRSNKKHTLTRHFPTKLFNRPQAIIVVDAELPMQILEIDHSHEHVLFSCVHTADSMHTHRVLMELIEICET